MKYIIYLIYYERQRNQLEKQGKIGNVWDCGLFGKWGGFCCEVIIQQMSLGVKTQQNKREDRAGSPNLVKLPYLKSSKPLNNPTGQKQRKIFSLHQDFNLHNNFWALPEYKPLEDHNLAYFLQKPKNKQLIDQLKLTEMHKHRAKPHQRYTKPSKQQQLPHRRYSSINSSVTKDQFLKYLQSVRGRVTSQNRSSLTPIKAPL